VWSDAPFPCRQACGPTVDDAALPIPRVLRTSAVTKVVLGLPEIRGKRQAPVAAGTWKR
jgi:hypothetical protein